LEDSQEIQEALGRSYGIGDEIDDADLESELACLEDELEGEELGLDSPAYLQPSALPVQPNSVPLPGAPTATTGLPNGANRVDEYGLPV
jgi:charged multivesicular body protein 5